MAYHAKAAWYYDFFADKTDLPFIRRMMLRFGGPVLDLATGTGRVALDLAGAGLEVVGVDNSRHMLEVAQAKLDRQGPSVKERLELVEGDMADLPLRRSFKSAIIAGGSFAHLLSSRDQLGCLKSVANLLEPGGKLVLDLIPPDRELVNGGTQVGRSINVDGDVSLLRTIHWRSDLNLQRVWYTTIYEKYRGNVLQERVLEESVISLLFPREVQLLLEQAGFSVEEILGDTAGGSFNSSSRRLIIMGVKK